MTKFFYSLLMLTLFGMQLSIAQQSESYQTSVYFAYKKSDLSAQAKQTIDKTFAQIQAQTGNNYQITLTGLADSVGNVAANHRLAQSRALAVKNYAVSLGIVAEKITIKVLGERPATTEAEHHRNRRVDIALSWQKPLVVVKTPVKKPKEQRIQTFFDAVEQTQQVFVIDNSRDTILQGKQGTRILFYAQSFYTRSSSPITIKLREYYNYADMIMAQLTTTSRKRLLETGGMLHITATQDGKEVRLKGGKNFSLMLPTNTLQENMQVFNGERDNEGFIDWRLDRRGNVLRGRIGIGCLRGRRSCWLRHLFSTIFQPKYRKMRARYRKIKAQMNEADKLLLAENMEQAQKDAYLMNDFRLGWTNCDAFPSLTAKNSQWVKPKIKMLPHHTRKNARYFLAFHQIRSLIMGLKYTRQNLQFIRLPKNEKATLIALEYKDDQVLIASEEVRIDDVVGKNLQFKSYTIAEAQEVIKKLTSFEQIQTARGR